MDDAHDLIDAINHLTAATVALAEALRANGAQAPSREVFVDVIPPLAAGFPAPSVEVVLSPLVHVCAQTRAL